MKKYITPNMDIRIFSDLTETAVSVVTPGEVPGLAGIPEGQKTQVELREMAVITKFTF